MLGVGQRHRHGQGHSFAPRHEVRGCLGNFFACGAHLLPNFNEPDLRKAIVYFEEATKLDPDYALAYAKLAAAWRALAALYLSDPEPIADAYRRARAAAETSLRLAPDLSEGFVSRGFVKLTADLDLTGAGDDFRRALELAPGDYRPTDALGYLLAAQGRLDEGATLARRAVELDPLSITPLLNLGRIDIATNRLDEAEATIRKAISLQPALSHAHAYLATIDLLHNDVAGARREADLEPAGFWREYADALARQREGDRPAADAALRAFMDKYSYGGPFQIALPRMIRPSSATAGSGPPESPAGQAGLGSPGAWLTPGWVHRAGPAGAAGPDGGPFQIAIVCALRKDPDGVFKWLDRSFEVRDSGLTQLFVSPFLIDYRNDPRFIAVAAKLGVDSRQGGN